MEASLKSSKKLETAQMGDYLRGLGIFIKWNNCMITKNDVAKE